LLKERCDAGRPRGAKGEKRFGGYIIGETKMTKQRERGEYLANQRRFPVRDSKEDRSPEEEVEHMPGEGVWADKSKG